MKRSYMVFLFLILLVFVSLAYGQDSIVKRTRQNEIVAVNAALSQNRIRNAFDNHKIKIDIIGWTPEGLLAYRIPWHSPNFEQGGYRLMIVDMINDQHVENETVITYGRAADVIDETRIAEITRRWNRILDRYGIGQIENPLEEIEEGGYQRFGSGIECWYDYEIIREQYTWNNIDWDLIVGLDGKQKTISSGPDFYDTAVLGRSSTFGRKIIGYYRSPYENRIAVLTIVFEETWDGLVTSARMNGCHLGVGFN